MSDDLVGQFAVFPDAILRQIGPQVGLGATWRGDRTSGFGDIQQGAGFWIAAAKLVEVAGQFRRQDDQVCLA